MLGIQKPIALDPGVGGHCIGPSALQPADIIVSTTSEMGSTVIRLGTSSVVSHASLYIGDGKVIEAIPEGVVVRPLSESLKDAALAVAYRSPHSTTGIAAAIVKSAMAHQGKPYSKLSAIRSTIKIRCRVQGSQPSAFFCSQFVIEAYKQGGLHLTNTPSQCVTPDDVVEIAIQGLTYVGHLKGDPAWFPKISP